MSGVGSLCRQIEETCRARPDLSCIALRLLKVTLATLTEAKDAKGPGQRRKHKQLPNLGGRRATQHQQQRPHSHQQPQPYQQPPSYQDQVDSAYTVVRNAAPLPPLSGSNDKNQSTNNNYPTASDHRLAPEGQTANPHPPAWASPDPLPPPIHRQYSQVPGGAFKESSPEAIATISGVPTAPGESLTGAEGFNHVSSTFHAVPLPPPPQHQSLSASSFPYHHHHNNHVQVCGVSPVAGGNGGSTPTTRKGFMGHLKQLQGGPSDIETLVKERKQREWLDSLEQQIKENKARKEERQRQEEEEQRREERRYLRHQEQQQQQRQLLLQQLQEYQQHPPHNPLRDNLQILSS